MYISVDVLLCLDHPILETFDYPLSLKHILKVFFENFLPMTIAIDVKVYFLFDVALVNETQLPRNLVADIIFKKHTRFFPVTHKRCLVTVYILARNCIFEAI